MLSRLRYRAASTRVCAMTAAILLTIAWLTPTSAIERISNDSGGRIGTYLTKFSARRRTGQPVMIDGTCASACTMLLGVIPRSRICVTPRAVLAFHSAWNPTSEGEQVSSAGNYYLWANYPSAIRRWIMEHGGLHSRIIYLSGRELAAMYPACR